MNIPFNRPYMTGRELENIQKAHAAGQLAGNGAFTRQCHDWLERRTGAYRAFLTHSCTDALEMASLLLDLHPGDEVIMPSFTFVSTANAFVLRGGVPVFVDIRPDTLNLDETRVEAAMTSRTKAVVAVHYAGVGCALDILDRICKRRSIRLVEDTAQGLGAAYQNRSLGSWGSLSTLSFHETKNIISGEGGALLVNDPELVSRAEVVWQKGTNRNRFIRGEVEKYEWVDLGSSYLPGELMAAFLAAQMDEETAITTRRRALWETYHQAFEAAERRGWCRRPIVPTECTPNAHIYYLLLSDPGVRFRLLEALNSHGIGAVFHYVPLHNSKAGLQYGRIHGDMAVTERVAQTLIRLPLWLGLEPHQNRVIQEVVDQLSKIMG